MTPLHPLITIVLIGIGATAFMDLWLLALHRAGGPAPNFAMVGRWVGHFAHGRFTHPAIAKAPAVRGEQLIGWLVHYAIGIAFAGALVSATGADWLKAPTLIPALAFGLASVVAPLCVMQPAMGAGFASSRTPTPLRNCARSVANHAAFGIGLYLTAALISRVAP